MKITSLIYSISYFFGLQFLLPIFLRVTFFMRVLDSHFLNNEITMKSYSEKIKYTRFYNTKLIKTKTIQKSLSLNVSNTIIRLFISHNR